jgi:DegV family protein with EDD domain
MIGIVTDSTCDLPRVTTDALGIRVIPLYINIGEQGFLDGVDISRENFYQALPTYPTAPTTAAPGAAHFRRVYEELAAEGADQILSIHISTSLSATPEIARSAAAETSVIPVTVLDSRQLSLGTGFLVEVAAKAAREGQPMDQILRTLEDQIARTHVFAALDTLDFLRRSGRMNWALAGLGTVLRIKPLLKMYEGNPTSERVRTTNGATKRLAEIMTSLAPFERVALVHTHSPDRAEAIRHEVAHLLPSGEIPSVDITPVIGAHLGPGAAGFALIQAKE